MSTHVMQIQRRLLAEGHNPGPIDGIIGRLTMKAVKSFRIQRGLPPNGGMNDAFYEAINGGANPKTPPPWYIEAVRVQGLHEKRHNKRLSDWLRSDGKYLGDPAKNPWCGDFVQTAMALTLPDEPLPANPYLAANWVRFGNKTTPQLGAVLVFWRGSPQSWKGHVGFYASEDATHYLVLGGNQTNAVTLARISKHRLRKQGVRWPSTFDDPKRGRINADLSGVTETTNEA